MYTKKEPITLSFRREATSTADFTMKTQPWEDGDIFVIDAVSVCNADNDGSKATIGVQRGGYTMYIETLSLTTADIYYISRPRIHLYSGYRLIVEFEDHTSGDLYYVNLFGHFENCIEEKE